MSSHEIRSSGVIRKVTKSDTVDIPLVDGQGPRAIVCGTAGTCTFLDATNTLCTDFPLQAGVNMIKPLRILTGGTADDIWALF